MDNTASDLSTEQHTSLPKGQLTLDIPRPPRKLFAVRTCDASPDTHVIIEIRGREHMLTFEQATAIGKKWLEAYGNVAPDTETVTRDKSMQREGNTLTKQETYPGYQLQTKVIGADNNGKGGADWAGLNTGGDWSHLEAGHALQIARALAANERLIGEEVKRQVMTPDAEKQRAALSPLSWQISDDTLETFLHAHAETLGTQAVPAREDRLAFLLTLLNDKNPEHTKVRSDMLETLATIGVQNARDEKLAAEVRQSLQEKDPRKLREILKPYARAMVSSAPAQDEAALLDSMLQTLHPDRSHPDFNPQFHSIERDDLIATLQDVALHLRDDGKKPVVGTITAAVAERKGAATEQVRQ